jgi:hypothetical protein
MKTIFILVGVLLVASSTLQAQWPKFSPPGVPKTADGKVNLAGPTPRTADGKPDLSGVWETIPGRRPNTPAVAAEGTGELPPSGSIFGNIGDQIPGGAPYQPWAAELVKKRMADNSKDNPDAHCLPMGVMQMTSHPYPKKIIQTPSELVMIYEGSGTTVREIFMDGRTLPKDVEPWWNGYSVGRWDGDTLVIETTGFMDDGWLDVRGSPFTSAGKLTERIRRPNYGSLVIEVTIDDPKAYTKPFTVRVNHRIMVDSEMIEFICNENEKSTHHIQK